jgi:hypothetical protein
MPTNINRTLISGMQETPHWWLDIGQVQLPEKLRDAFYARRKTSMKWTTGLVAELGSVAEEARRMNNLKTDARTLAERFVEHDFVGGLDKWHQQMRERRRERR